MDVGPWSTHGPYRFSKADMVQPRGGSAAISAISNGQRGKQRERARREDRGIGAHGTERRERLAEVSREGQHERRRQRRPRDRRLDRGHQQRDGRRRQMRGGDGAVGEGTRGEEERKDHAAGAAGAGGQGDRSELRGAEPQAEGCSRPRALERDRVEQRLRRRDAVDGRLERLLAPEQGLRIPQREEARAEPRPRAHIPKCDTRGKPSPSRIHSSKN